MMQDVTLFYATNNKSKLHNMYYRLRDFPIKVICPYDIDIHIDIEENGDSVISNVLIKAIEYYKVVQMPVIAGDTGLYIDGLNKEEQPGLYVRRINGKNLSDNEMIDYYCSIAKRIGEPCYIHYITGIALITNKGTMTKEISEPPLRFSSNPNINRKHRGNPLDVITLTEEGKSYNELTDDERIDFDRVGEQEFTDFIVKNLL